MKNDMARMQDYADDELIANPFAFAAPAPVAPAMLAPVAAPVAAYQAPTAREMRDGVGKDGQVAALSQTQGYGMVPVYKAQEGRGPDRGQPVLMGYEFNPYEAGLTTVDVPKPAAILAEEKRIGKEMEPTYATYTAPRKGPGGGGGESVAYGPPTGYRYDNGQSQYVKFDSGGNYYETEQRKGDFDNLLPLIAILGSAYLGPLAFEALGLTGAGGAGLLGAEGATAALGAGEVAAAGEAAALGGLGGSPFAPAASLAGATPGYVSAAGGAGLLADTAALGAGTTAANLTPAAIESLLGTAGYGVNASALEAALAAGIPAAQVGAGALLPFEGVTALAPQLTPAAIESGLGTPGYGVNASAIESGLFSPELIGAGAAIGAPLTLPSWATVPNALLAANVASSIAKANETTPTAAPFTMAPYVPPSGKPFANIAMSPIAAPYTPTRILGQYDPTMTPGGVSPYELIMAQMQAPQNLYADFEAGTNIGGYDPQRFVVPPAAAATALPNNMGGMINKSRMVGPDPMGPDTGFASIQDGEFVMNRKATQKYGIELMNAINSGKISKGKLIGLLQA